MNRDNTARTVGGAIGVVGSLATVSGAGTISGLGMTGITSGLAAVGLGGGMLVGLVVVAALPVGCALVGPKVYQFFKNRLR